MKIEREMTNLTLEDMCWLMCGGPEDESEEDKSEEDNDQQRSQENTDRSI